MTKPNDKIIQLGMDTYTGDGVSIFEVIARWRFKDPQAALELQQALLTFSLADAPAQPVDGTPLVVALAAQAGMADPMGLAPGKNVDDLSTIPGERAPKRQRKVAPDKVERQPTPAEEAIKTDTAAQQRASAVQEAPEVEAEPVEAGGDVPVALREAKAFGGVMQYLIKDHPLPAVSEFLENDVASEVDMKVWADAAADAVEAECERVRQHVPAIARADKSSLRARIERALEHVKVTQGQA